VSGEGNEAGGDGRGGADGTGALRALLAGECPAGCRGGPWAEGPLAGRAPWMRWQGQGSWTPRLRAREGAGDTEGVPPIMASRRSPGAPRPCLLLLLVLLVLLVLHLRLGWGHGHVGVLVVHGHLHGLGSSCWGAWGPSPGHVVHLEPRVHSHHARGRGAQPGPVGVAHAGIPWGGAPYWGHHVLWVLPRGALRVEAHGHECVEGRVLGHTCARRGPWGTSGAPMGCPGCACCSRI